jgi:hypothetical protein
MCFPHIINICVQHVVEKFTDVTLVDSEDDFDDDLSTVSSSVSGQTFQQAVDRDPIALGRRIVRAIRSSGQRREAFENLTNEGIKQHWFVIGTNPEENKYHELLRDVKTRWDSMFQMIRRLRVMRPVSHHYSN